MPEREYFSLRYAIPGFTFLLLVVLINHVPLLIVFADSDFGIFLGLLSLLSGSAMGFLVAQFWWWWYHRSFWKEELLRKLEKVLIEQYEKHGLRLPQESEERKVTVIAVCDYISHSQRKKEIIDLVTRRWDMFHTLSSTLFALVMGVGVGIGLRIYYQIFIFNDPFAVVLLPLALVVGLGIGVGRWIYHKYLVLEPLSRLLLFLVLLCILISIPFWENAEAIALILIFLCVGIVALTIREEREKNWTVYLPLEEALIKKSEVTWKNLREAFSKCFPPGKHSNN